jgi:hypothetical protein
MDTLGVDRGDKADSASSSGDEVRRSVLRQYLTIKIEGLS